MTASPFRTDGYVTDVAYPDHFHRELMPLWLVTALQALGRSTLALEQPFVWLELGCGTGMCTVIAAATHPQGQFIGLDFNPEEIDQARALAQAAGVHNVRFVCASFEQALNDPELQLPACDFIVSHGVYSWVSHHNRAAIRALVHRLLQPGGLFYVAYMSHPGSSSMSAAQKLTSVAAQHAQGSSTQKALAGLALLEQLSRSGAGYFSEHPRIAPEIQQLRAMDPRYIAHEFLNAHWESLHAADVITDMQAVDCDYAGSATLLENIDAASLPERTLPLLAQLQQQGANMALQETFRDLARNQNQRRDIYQRRHPQGNLLSPDAHRHALLAQRICLLPQAPDTQTPLPPEFTLDTRIGPVHIPMAHIAPLLAALQPGPCTYADLLKQPLYARQPALVSQLLQLLAWAGWLQFLHPDWQAGTPAAVASLNTQLQHRFAAGTAARVVAAAACGGAVAPLHPQASPAQRQRMQWLGAA